MLRQLARLTRPVPAAGPGALAIAIYADPSGAPAAAVGEGVACVDDAARAFELLALVWQATRSDRIRQWAAGLLDFVLWMHRGDGTWSNFIRDWSGEVDVTGSTSVAGVNFWQARALSAAVAAVTILGDERARPLVGLGFAAAVSTSAPSDVRSLHALALGQWMVAGQGRPSAHRHLGEWADTIADTRCGDVLMNSADETGTPHLWAHVQEAALVRAGLALGRPELIDIAATSAAAFVGPAIESGFDLLHVQPYDVQSAICVMDALAEATQQLQYANLAALGRQWFTGRNPARRPVYDRRAGMVADGIDAGVVSRNSGAESNIVGGLALLEDAVEAARSVWPAVR